MMMIKNVDHFDVLIERAKMLHASIQNQSIMTKRVYVIKI